MTTEGECRFNRYCRCEEHRSPEGFLQDAALCTHAAQALQASLVVANMECSAQGERLTAIALLVGAQDYSDIVECVQALQRRMEEAEEQLNEARKALGSWMKDYETVRGAILNLRQAEMTAIGNNEEYQSRLASLEAQNAALMGLLERALQYIQATLLYDESSPPVAAKGSKLADEIDVTLAPRAGEEEQK